MTKKLSLLFLILVSGCTPLHGGTDAHLLKAGDKVRIQYSCQTPDGALAAANTPVAAGGQRLSAIFIPHKGATPADYTVPGHDEKDAVDQDMSMEEKVEHYLLRQAVGNPLGEQVALTVAGELFNVRGGDRYLPMRRKFAKKRRVTMSVNAFKHSFALEPAAGLHTETKVPGMSARVLTVQGDSVEILYAVKPGTHIPSVFGEIAITQNEDELLMVTQARDGALVRSGGSLVGKITKVTEEGYEVDYGHSFGFVPLTCQVVFRKPGTE